MTTATAAILPIPRHDGSVTEAYRDAVDRSEPRFVPASIYADDRGWSLMNQLQGVMTDAGQVNYSHMYPGVCKAWHHHNRQTDFWLVVRGCVKVGVHCEQTDRRWMGVSGVVRPGVTIIPPPLWHGVATVGDEPAGLLYYVTHAYDPANPDEMRRPFDAIDFPWGVEHR